MKDEKIKSIHLVTSMGMGDEFIVGESGVTEIRRSEIFTSPDEIIPTFEVYKGDELIATISMKTPFVIEY